MARAETIFLSLCIYLAFLTTISLNNPIPSEDDKLIEELEELSNIIHSKTQHNPPPTGEVDNAIYPEVGNQPALPSRDDTEEDNEVPQILDEHINLPTTLPPRENTLHDSDSIELQLFEVGRDKEGNRIYGVDSDSNLEKQLEALEDESGGSASEEDDDLEDQLEGADLVKQLEELSHHDESPTESEPSLTVVPSKLKPSVETSESSSGDSSLDGSGDSAELKPQDNRPLFKETQNVPEFSGDGANQSMLKETQSMQEFSGDGANLFVIPAEGEGSGALVKDEGFIPVTKAGVLVPEGSGEGIGNVDESSGDDFLKTIEPVFVFTTMTTEANKDDDITALTTTIMASKTSKDEVIPQTKTVAQHCPDSHFECRSNHHCVPQSVVCDLIPDCGDQSDEDPQICSPERTCSEGFFKCGESPQCVDEDNRCDGIYHCYNGEDESNCLSCIGMNGHKKMLLRSDFCDGYQDCKNNMDEDDKRCSKPCSAGYQHCDDGLQCIKEDLFCNGISNCHDKSDEKQCSRTMLDCWSFNMFACDGVCQPESNLCDYFNDCSDGIDEIGCKYEPKTCPKDFIYQTETDTCLHSSLIYSEPYDLLQILDQVNDEEDQIEELEKRGLLM